MTEPRKPTPRLRWLTGWLRRLAEANDRQLGGIPPVCCGAGMKPQAFGSAARKPENKEKKEDR